MKQRDHEYRFKIDVFSVESIPMARLAQYMWELSKLLGEPERVHFARLEEGSTILISRIEEPAYPKVTERVASVRRGEGPKDAMDAYRSIDTMLAKDNAIGALTPAGIGGEVIPFPGRTRPKPTRYGPFRERGSIDGVLIRIGGQGDRIPLQLQDGDAVIACHTSLDTSKRMAQYYRESTLRAFGEGRWVREENGSWELLDFFIEDFEVLDDAPLADVIQRLHAVEGSRWGESEDPVSDILELRRDPRDHN
jgi:hypothetical protein